MHSQILDTCHSVFPLFLSYSLCLTLVHTHPHSPIAVPLTPWLEDILVIQGRVHFAFWFHTGGESMRGQRHGSKSGRLADCLLSIYGIRESRKRGEPVNPESLLAVVYVLHPGSTSRRFYNLTSDATKCGPSVQTHYRGKAFLF